VFKKFVLSLSNHKTIESIKLMNFLLKRRTTKNIDLTYEVYNLEENDGYPFGGESRRYLDEKTVKEAIAKSNVK
jgi:hypothetical protein